MIRDLIEIGQLIIWGAVIFVAFLAGFAAWLIVAIGAAAFDRIAVRYHRRRDLHRIENYANHPIARRQHTPDRKENES